MQARLRESVVDVLIIAGDGCARCRIADVPLYLRFGIQAGRVGCEIDMQGSFGRDARVSFGSLFVTIKKTTKSANIFFIFIFMCEYLCKIKEKSGNFRIFFVIL